jgi:hypothetical protein
METSVFEHDGGYNDVDKVYRESLTHAEDRWKDVGRRALEDRTDDHLTISGLQEVKETVATMGTEHITNHDIEEEFFTIMKDIDIDRIEKVC